MDIAAAASYTRRGLLISPALATDKADVNVSWREHCTEDPPEGTLTLPREPASINRRLILSSLVRNVFGNWGSFLLVRTSDTGGHCRPVRLGLSLSLSLSQAPSRMSTAPIKLRSTGAGTSAGCAGLASGTGSTRTKLVAKAQHMVPSAGQASS
jgi:hypothetical protein